MGPDNQALLRALGLGLSQGHDEVRLSIHHPCRPGERLWFLFDPVHVLKNITSMLSSNKEVLLSGDVVSEEGLLNNTVRLQDIQDLLDYEKKIELKLAYRFKQDNLEQKKHFAKMKVGNSTAVFCKRTEAGLKAKALVTGDTSNDAGAFFVGLVSKWFQVVTNRSPKMALSRRNPELYQANIDHIKKTARVFRTMKVGKDHRWKPVQQGMLIVCAVLEVREFYLTQIDLVVYVFLGRFTMDFVENVHSLIRCRQAIPNALQFKHCLRVVNVAQICLAAENLSYFRDTSEDVLLPTDFLSVTRELAEARRDPESLDQLFESAAIHVAELQEHHLALLEPWEWMVVYLMVGATLRSMKKMKMKMCEDCLSTLLWKGDGSHPCAMALELIEYKNGTLLAASDFCFKVRRSRSQILQAVA